jgi:hypothetical protein
MLLRIGAATIPGTAPASRRCGCCLDRDHPWPQGEGASTCGPSGNLFGGIRATTSRTTEIARPRSLPASFAIESEKEMAKIGLESHPAPTPLHPNEYTLFFIPGRLAPEVESVFADLDEPDELFFLVPVMRVDQLAWRPDRIKRSDVRALSDRHDGIWAALTSATQVNRLREILRNHGLA